MTKKEFNKIKELLEMDMKPEDITYLVKTSYGEICKVAGLEREKAKELQDDRGDDSGKYEDQKI